MGGQAGRPRRASAHPEVPAIRRSRAPLDARDPLAPLDLLEAHADANFLSWSVRTSPVRTVS